MPNFYCKCCGVKYPTISGLTGASCPRHELGPNKGKHVLYEGDEKKDYFCKLCGVKYPTLSGLTGASCPRHPLGPNKGKHSPAN